jgi:polyhydroxybutyrate depolymerase
MTHATISALAALALVACGSSGASSDDTSSAASSGDGGTHHPSTTSTPTSDATMSTAATSVDDGPDSGTTSAQSSAQSSSDASADGVDLGSGEDSGLGPGCGNTEAPAGEGFRSLMIRGVERTFIVDAPSTIDPDVPLALVFVFHGNGGNGQASQGMGLQNVSGAQDQAVFVFPDGVQYMGFGVGWDAVCEEYDMAFFDEMVSTLSDDYCIDSDRIFAGGFSWGGDMCQALACCRGETVRAIAPASGPEFFPDSYPAACPDTARPAFRMTYATNDAYPPQMFADTIEWHRTEQNCSPRSAPIDPDPCLAYEGCDEPVIACEYEGLGHAWPADWADESWAFFSQFE